MPSAIFHLTLTDNFPRNFSIEQGSTFSWFTLVLDGDFTTWQPKGQIRDKYASDGGIVKAEFAFDPLNIGDVELPDGSRASGTIVRPTLSSTATRSFDWLETKMVSRASANERAIPGRNIWLYDIELTSLSTGEVMRVVSGYVEVSSEVTR